MRKTIVMIGLALTAAALQGSAAPTPARCAMCFTGTCYNSRMCFRDCVCLKRGMDLDGQCFSASALPATGYTVLP